MSYTFYSKWWVATRENLEKLLIKEPNIIKLAENQKSRSLANQLIGGLYAKYCVLLQDLGTILDQMAQPQKRIIVRKLMDIMTQRLCELNEELRKIDISEYHYVDGALIELKLVPQNVEILAPVLYYLCSCDLEELWTKIKDGKNVYTPSVVENVQINDIQTEIIVESTKKPKNQQKKYLAEDKMLTEEENKYVKIKKKTSLMVKLIQTMERGRAIRLYFLDKLQYYNNSREMRLKEKHAILPQNIKQNAAIQIQKVWKGYCSRKVNKQNELKRRFLIKMIEPSWQSNKEFVTLEQNLQKRRDFRDIRIREYIKANLEERTRVFKVIGTRLMEDISDEIREWFFQWYTQVKNFDKYPPLEKGGTIIVVRGETLTPKEWIDDVEKKKVEKRKNKRQDKEQLKKEKQKQNKLKAELKKKEIEKRKKEKERMRKKKLKPWDFKLELDPTVTKDLLKVILKEYNKLFTNKRDAENCQENFYMDNIYEEKCYEMQIDLRKIIDEMMRLELQLLENALERDRAKRRKKIIKSKKKKTKKKKIEKKDLTAHRTIGDLIQELVNNGIVHSYKTNVLKDYKGDYSFTAREKRNWNFDPPTCLGDVRQTIKINCIAPLSAEGIKKPRSVLIIGPRQSGKHLLVNAILTESQSVLFDLSPEVWALKYEGQQGLKMLLHLINKLSRIMQPSVIYFNAAEHIFYKKVPKTEKDIKPKRIGKKVFKQIVKMIKPEDKILLLGISKQPWLANQNQIRKCFDRVILLPRPDYGSVYLYWQSLLMPYHGVDRNINLSCLAQLTTFFPLQKLKEAVEHVMTPNRIIELSYNPLKQPEVLEALINETQITNREFKKFEKFYYITELGREQNRLNKYNEKIRKQKTETAQKQQQKQTAKK